ncbi:MAG: hypothetical protein IPM38_12405 [Ignavibacteria bacterium]|nr:hypothetical protein [Ignavibacteria bacterium]
MKYKKNYLSSVIVSLLAGFIYYQFSTDLEKSFNEVFTANELEINVPLNGDDALSNFNNPQKIASVKKIFRKSKGRITPLNAFAESGISDYNKENQAKTKKPVPDKNVDFTAELNNLLKKKDKPVELRKSKSLNNTTADNNTTQRLQRSVINKECFSASVNKDIVNGNGFEYNYVYNVNSKLKNKVKGKTKETGSKNSDLEIGTATQYSDENLDSENCIVVISDECSDRQYQYSHKYKSKKEFKIKSKNNKKVYTNSNKNININIDREIKNNTDCKKNKRNNNKSEINIEIHTLEDETQQ